MFKNGTSAALTSAGETIFVNAAVYGAAGCEGDAPQPDPVAAAVVVGNPGALSADDQKLVAMVGDAVGAANVTVTDDNAIAAGPDLYVVAPSVSSGTAGGSPILQSTEAAAVILKPWVGKSSRLGMFTSSGTANGTTVSAIASNHEVTTGFTGNVVISGGPKLSYGQPIPGADVLASLPGGQPSLIVYEPGVVEIQGQDVGCRAMFPTFKQGAIASITTDGETLFDQLITFVTGDCVS